MKNKARLFVYSALAIPFVAFAVFVLMLDSHDRLNFLSDFGSTTMRLVRGEWKFEELSETKRHVPTNRRGRGRYVANHADIFWRLDRNADGRLTADEVGRRLRASFPRFDRDQDDALGPEEFQRGFFAGWRKQVDASKNSPRTIVDADYDIDGIENGESAISPLNADDLFRIDRVLPIEIRLAAEDWDSLRRQSRSPQSAFENPLNKPYTNFQADLIIDGVKVQKVAIRKKGFIGSQDTERPSLKIKFDEYVEQQPIVGLDRLTLNNNRQDRGLISQFLTYVLFRKAGVPAPRCSFASVTVNGQYLGIYSHIESIRKPFLAASFGDDSGNLYEGTLTDFYPKSIDWLEAKTNRKEDDRSKALLLSELLFAQDSTLEEIAEVVELDSFFRYWAVESLLNFWDGYTQNQNNYFVYDNPETGKFHFMPWGADSCFEGRRGFGRSNGRDAVSVRATSILANRLYHARGVPDRYREAMLLVLKHVWNEDEILQQIDQLEALLFDELDFGQLGSLEARDAVRDFVRGRRSKIMSELTEEWPVEVADQPRIPTYTDQVGSIEGTCAFSNEDAEKAQADRQEHTQAEDHTEAEDQQQVQAASDAANPFAIDLSITLDGTKRSLQSVRMLPTMDELVPPTLDQQTEDKDWIQRVKAVLGTVDQIAFAGMHGDQPVMLTCYFGERKEGASRRVLTGTLVDTESQFDMPIDGQSIRGEMQWNDDGFEITAKITKRRQRRRW